MSLCPISAQLCSLPYLRVCLPVSPYHFCSVQPLYLSIWSSRLLHVNALWFSTLTMSLPSCLSVPFARHFALWRCRSAMIEHQTHFWMMWTFLIIWMMSLFDSQIRAILWLRWINFIWILPQLCLEDLIRIIFQLHQDNIWALFEPFDLDTLDIWICYSEKSRGEDPHLEPGTFSASRLTCISSSYLNPSASFEKRCVKPSSSVTFICKPL